MTQSPPPQEVPELPPLLKARRALADELCYVRKTPELRDAWNALCDAIDAAAADAQRWQFVKKHRPAVLCSIAWFWGSATKDAVANDPDKAMDAAMADEAMRQGAQHEPR